MKLSKIYVRFYKSFNFDDVLKATPNAAKRGDWEDFEGDWYPYVEVTVEDGITAIVGANESGKSHLLGAVERAITGSGFSQRDLCRYCDFFDVERGRRFWPHVGLAWSALSADETAAIGAIAGDASSFDRFLMFRETPGQITLWLPEGGGFRPIKLDQSQSADLSARLPSTFRIEPSEGLPSSVPLAWLADQTTTPLRTDRVTRGALLDSLQAVTDLASDPEAAARNGATIYQTLQPATQAMAAMQSTSAAELNLARALLLDVAKIEPKRFADLVEAVRDGHDGYVNAIIESMNEQIAERLNFRRWWVQDRDFALRVSAREHELVMTIRDRTGTEYTFEERSNGLRFFLSYLIQSLTNRGADGKAQILLMDEPDAHLSAEAQQDLLRVFADLADPADGAPPLQVLYVTHSPFLLDKNHAERIRVLEKGHNLDGTRVIRVVSQNHYEPLRSAFGASAGETAFVGAVNLLVEGPADQILLAGAARLTRARRPGRENTTLDLNRLTIVPCGSASQVPYMAYLIRGRDTRKPPVVALLDSDGEGDKAAAVMRTEERFKRHLPVEFVLQLGELFQIAGMNVAELEDLIPTPLALAAANLVLGEAAAFREGEAPELGEATLAPAKAGQSIFDRIEAAAAKKKRTVGKLAFARAVVEVAAMRSAEKSLATAISSWLDAMETVFNELNIRRRKAESLAQHAKLSGLIEAQIQIFQRDRQGKATREQVSNLLDHLVIQMDDSDEAAEISARINQLRTAMKLADDPALPIEDYTALIAELRRLRAVPEILRQRPVTKPPAVVDATPAPKSRLPRRGGAVEA